MRKLSLLFSWYAAAKGRADAELSAALPYSRTQISKWIKEGALRLNEETFSARVSLKPKDLLSLETELHNEHEWESEPDTAEKALERQWILYEHPEFLIINKPAGLVVYPALGNLEGTLANALLSLYPELKTLPRAGFVHRIDKDTTGLLLITRTQESQTRFSGLIQSRRLKRTYRLLTQGVPNPLEGSIDRPIGRDTRARTKMSIREDGKPALTDYKTLEIFKHSFAYVEARLQTGRTHQIRLHFQSQSWPLLGEKTYAPKRRTYGDSHSRELLLHLHALDRQMLHAHSLTFHYQGEDFHFESPLPQDFQETLGRLRAER